MVSPQTVYELGRDWYATRLDLQYEPFTAEQTQSTFSKHGLVGDFWSLAGEGLAEASSRTPGDRLS